VAGIGTGTLDKGKIDPTVNREFYEGKKELEQLLRHSLVSVLRELFFKQPHAHALLVGRALAVASEKSEVGASERKLDKDKLFPILDAYLAMHKVEQEDPGKVSHYRPIMEFFQRQLSIKAHLKKVEKVKDRDEVSDFLKALPQEVEYFNQLRRIFNPEYLREHLGIEEEKRAFDLAVQKVDTARKEIEITQSEIDNFEDQIRELKLRKLIVEDKETAEIDKEVVGIETREIKPRKDALKDKKMALDAEEKAFQIAARKFIEAFYKKFQTVQSDITEAEKGKTKHPRFDEFLADVVRVFSELQAKKTLEEKDVVTQINLIREMFFQKSGKVEKIIGNIEAILSKKDAYLNNRESDFQIETLGQLLEFYKFLKDVEVLEKTRLVPLDVRMVLERFRKSLEENCDVSFCGLVLDEPRVRDLQRLFEEFKKDCLNPENGIFFQFKGELDRVLEKFQSGARSKNDQEVYEAFQKVEKALLIIEYKSSYSYADRTTISDAVKAIDGLIDTSGEEGIRTRVPLSRNVENVEMLRNGGDLQLLVDIRRSLLNPEIPIKKETLEGYKKVIRSSIEFYETGIEKLIRQNLEIVFKEAMSLVGVVESHLFDFLMQGAKETFTGIEATLKMICSFKEGEARFLDEDQQKLCSSFVANVRRAIQDDADYQVQYEVMIEHFAGRDGGAAGIYDDRSKSMKLAKDQLAQFKTLLQEFSVRIDERHCGLLPRVGRMTGRTLLDELAQLQKAPPPEFETQWNVLIKATNATLSADELRDLNTYITTIERKKLSIAQPQIDEIKRVWGTIYNRGKISNKKNLAELISKMAEVGKQNAGAAYYLEKQVKALIQLLGNLGNDFKKDVLDAVFYRAIIILLVVLPLSVFGMKMGWHAAENLGRTSRVIPTKA
nr:hypothetical protein [Chlamydiota bacterium]